MKRSLASRREFLKVLGAIPAAAALPASIAGQQAAEDAGPGPASQARGPREPNAGPSFDGPLTASPTASAGGKPLLTMYSISLQWADYEEAAEITAQAGWTAIGWTVRGGGHVLPENVKRDLPRAVAAAKKAGLTVPIIITPIAYPGSPYAEEYLQTMNSLGLRYYQAPPLGRYDYTKDLQPQIDLWKPRIDAMSKLNEKYGTTAVYHMEGGAGNIGGGGWDLWMAIKDFDTKYIGMDIDVGHGTFKGGPELWELIRFAHRNTLALASKDIRWAKKTDVPQGPRRSDPSQDWQWTAEYVVPGTGMVNWKMVFDYLKAIQFAGPFLHYSEYFVDVPGKGSVSLLRPEVPKVVSKEQYIAAIRRDHEFFSKCLKDAGF